MFNDLVKAIVVYKGPDANMHFTIIEVLLVFNYIANLTICFAIKNYTKYKHFKGDKLTISTYVHLKTTQ